MLQDPHPHAGVLSAGQYDLPQYLHIAKFYMHFYLHLAIFYMLWVEGATMSTNYLNVAFCQKVLLDNTYNYIYI